MYVLCVCLHMCVCVVLTSCTQVTNFINMLNQPLMFLLSFFFFEANFDA